MNPQIYKLIAKVGTIITVFITLDAHPQAFVNLDFESANVPDVPAGQFGADVAVTEGLPGWTAYLGGGQVNQIGHNDISIGGAYISIQGPQWNSSQILQGQYTVLLQGQFSQTFPSPVSAAIAQTGQIPMTAHSLFFWGNNISLQVTFNGQVIPYSAFGSGPNYTIYGGDISALAGQTGELRFTGFNFGGDSLDNIMFSPQSVPEPSVFGLFALGSLLLGWRMRHKAW